MACVLGSMSLLPPMCSLRCWHVPGCLQASLQPVACTLVKKIRLICPQFPESSTATLPPGKPSLLALKLGHHNSPQAKAAETLSHTFSFNPLKEKEKDEEMPGCVGEGSVLWLLIPSYARPSPLPHPHPHPPPFTTLQLKLER